MTSSQTETPNSPVLFWKNLQKLLGTNINMSTAFHPQTDGQTERMNSVLEDMLRHYVSPDQQDWDLFLSLAEFCMHNCYKPSIQCTPFPIGLWEKSQNTIQCSFEQD